MPKQESTIHGFAKGLIHDTYAKEGYRLGIGVSISKDELHTLGLRVAKDHLDKGILQFPKYEETCGKPRLSIDRGLYEHEIVSAYTIDDTLFFIAAADIGTTQQRLFCVAEMDNTGNVNISVVAKLPPFPKDYFEMVGVRDGGEADKLRYRFYFIPKGTEPMTIVVYKDVTAGEWSSPDVRCNIYSLFPDVKPSWISFYKLVVGKLWTGAYQYSIRYISDFGTVTPWFPLTRRLIMPNGPLCYRGNAWEDRRLHEIGVPSGKGFRIRVHDIDDRFRYLQVAYVYYKSDKTPDHAAIFDTIDIHKCRVRDSGQWWGKEIYIDHTDMGGEIIDPSQFDVYYQAIKTAKTVEVSNNRIFFGNVEYDTRSKFRAVIPDPVNDVSVVNAPTAFRSIAEWSGIEYFRKPYVRPDFYGADCGSTSNCYTTLDYISIPLSSTRRRPAPIIYGYSDYRDVQMDFSFTGYKRGQRYRFGVVVFDKKMRPSFVSHLADITFPHMYEEGRDDSDRPYSKMYISTYDIDTCTEREYAKDIYLYPDVSGAPEFYAGRRLPVFENTGLGFECDASLLDILNKKCYSGTDITYYWEKYAVAALSLKRGVAPTNYSPSLEMIYSTLTMGLRLRVRIEINENDTWRIANSNDINGFLIVRAETDINVWGTAIVTPAVRTYVDCADRHGCGEGTFHSGSTIEQHPGIFPVMGLHQSHSTIYYNTLPCYGNTSLLDYWRAALNWYERTRNGISVSLHKVGVQMDDEFCWGDSRERICKLAPAGSLLYVFSPDIEFNGGIFGKTGWLDGTAKLRVAGLAIGVWGVNSCTDKGIFDEEFNHSVCASDYYRYHTVTLTPTIISHNPISSHGGTTFDMDFSRLTVHGRYTSLSVPRPYYQMGEGDIIDWVSSKLPAGPWTYCETIAGTGRVYANMMWLARGLIREWKSYPSYGSTVTFHPAYGGGASDNCYKYGQLVRDCTKDTILRKQYTLRAGGQSSGVLVKMRYWWSMFVSDCYITGVNNSSSALVRYSNWFFWDRHFGMSYADHHLPYTEAAIPVVEILDSRDSNELYGGLNSASLTSTKYITTGTFYPLLDGDDAYSDYLVVFGGDTYTGLYPFLYLLPHYDVPDGLTYSRVYIAPFETRKNFMMGTGTRVVSVDISGERSGCSGLFAITGDRHFVQNEKWQLASVALLQEALKFYFAKPHLFEEASHFPNRFVYSDKKIYGEFIDKFQSILPGYYFDCEGKYGEITASASFYDRLYMAQRGAINIIAVDETRVLPDTSGESLLLGVQSGIAYAKPITASLGVQDWYALLASSTGIYGIDNLRKAIFRIGSNGIETISNGRIKSLLDGILGENIAVTGDYKSRILRDVNNNNIIFVVGTGDKQFPLVYDEELGVFTGMDRMVPAWGGLVRGYLLTQALGYIPIHYDSYTDFTSGYANPSTCISYSGIASLPHKGRLYLWRVIDMHNNQGFNHILNSSGGPPSTPFVDFIVTTHYNYATVFDTIDIALDTFPFVRDLFGSADPTAFIDRIEFISEAGYSFITRNELKYREGIIRGPVKSIGTDRRHRGKWLLVRIWFNDNIDALSIPDDWYEPKTLSFKRLMGNNYVCICEEPGDLCKRITLPRIMSVRVNYRISMDI